MSRLNLADPPAGVLLVEPEKEGGAGTCVILATFLPYEYTFLIDMTVSMDITKKRIATVHVNQLETGLVGIMGHSTRWIDGIHGAQRVNRMWFMRSVFIGFPWQDIVEGKP